MKVLFVIDSLGSAGKERQLIELIKGLKLRKSVKSQIAVLSDHVYYPYVKDLTVRTYYLKRKTKKDISIFYNLYKICKEFRPDIIHSWERMCSIYAVPASKLLDSKFINGAIRNAPPKSKPFRRVWIRDKLTFPFSDVILANSKAGLESFNVPVHKGYYIHNGFNFSRIKNLMEPKAIRKKFEINTSNVVGMVGGFKIRKDFMTFILAAMHLVQKREDITFLAVGDGSNAAGDESKSTFEKCKKMVKPEFQERIKFLGKQNDIESIINIFDVGVLLTNQDVHGEGISNSIMEYMALEKPVIATAGGGTGEIVVRDETGFLIENDNVGQVVKKTEFLINNKETAKEMGSAGKERLMKDFSLEKMTDRYVELYRNLI
jgi:glycosyltransferase involved in cell wall biosynthesis